MDMMIQFIIGFTGLTALALTQFPVPKNWVKFAPIFGIMGQPFWVLSTIKTEQWGILILCICYSIVWIIGLYRFWIKKNKDGINGLMELKADIKSKFN